MFLTSGGPLDDGLSIQVVRGDIQNWRRGTCCEDDGGIQPLRTPRPPHQTYGSRGHKITDVMMVSKGVTFLVQTEIFNGNIQEWQCQSDNIKNWLDYKGFLWIPTRGTASGKYGRKRGLHSSGTKYIWCTVAVPNRTASWVDRFSTYHRAGYKRPARWYGWNITDKYGPDQHQLSGDGATDSTHYFHGSNTIPTKDTLVNSNKNETVILMLDLL